MSASPELDALSPALRQHLAALVEAEVASQLAPLRARLEAAIERVAAVERRTPSERATIII